RRPGRTQGDFGRGYCRCHAVGVQPGGTGRGAANWRCHAGPHGCQGRLTPGGMGGGQKSLPPTLHRGLAGDGGAAPGGVRGAAAPGGPAMTDPSAIGRQLIELLRLRSRTRAELYDALDISPSDLAVVIDRAAQEYDVRIVVGPVTIALERA